MTWLLSFNSSRLSRQAASARNRWSAARRERTLIVLASFDTDRTPTSVLKSYRSSNDFLERYDANVCVIVLLLTEYSVLI